MTVNAITDTKKRRTGIAPTYLHTTHILFRIFSSEKVKGYEIPTELRCSMPVEPIGLLRSVYCQTTNDHRVFPNSIYYNEKLGPLSWIPAAYNLSFSFCAPYCVLPQINNLTRPSPNLFIRLILNTAKDHTGPQRTAETSQKVKGPQRSSETRQSINLWVNVTTLTSRTLSVFTESHVSCGVSVLSELLCGP